MRKIFSILVVLGLVLGMVAMTAPAAAQPATDWSLVDVDIVDPCEFELATYNITFELNASLTQGFHSVTIMFPEGTGYPATWLDGHIVIGGEDVFADEIVQVGDEVTFLVPTTIDPGATWVAFMEVYDTTLGTFTGIINPAAGEYFLYVKTSRATMSTYVQSGYDNTYFMYFPYEILPAYSSYKYELDFSPTYPGMVADFVPPFQACGQNDTAQPAYPPDVDPFDTWLDTSVTPNVWVTNFTIDLFAEPEGCAGCDDMQKVIRLTSAPAGGSVRFYLGGTFNRTFSMGTAATRTFTWEGEEDLAFNYTESWEAGLHFNVPGTYTFSFDLVYGGPTVCTEYCQDYSKPYEFVVHQWKDAYPIPVYRKWNFISLPLHLFDTDIETVLSAFDWASALDFGAVWYYDGCTKEWAAYGNGQTSLTTMDAGKGYWLRTRYTSPVLRPAGEYLGQLWVFGHSVYRPGTPMGVPKEYPVCEEWNAIGFTRLANDWLEDYLWNFEQLGIRKHGPAIGWDAPTQFPFTVQFAGDLEPTHGYWVSFSMAGKIFP